MSRRTSAPPKAALILTSAALLLAPGIPSAHADPRASAIARYQGLLENPSPELAGRRDEFRIRLGALELESADVTNVPAERRRHQQRALALFDEILESRASMFRQEASYYRAITLLELGRVAEAEPAFRDYVATYPGGERVSESWYRIGAIAIERKAFDEAARAFEAAIRAGDARFRDNAVYMLAWTAHTTGRLDDARSALVGLLERLGVEGRLEEPVAEESLALIARVLHDGIGVRGLVGPWIGGTPAFVPRALRLLATLQLETGAFADAARTLEELLAGPESLPDRLDLEKRLVEAWQNAGDPARAHTVRERVIAGLPPRDPWRTEALRSSAHHLHEVARQGGRPADFTLAARGYDRWIESLPVGPERLEAVFLLGEVRREGGDLEGAAEVYATVARSRDPGRGEEAAFRRVAVTEALGAGVVDAIREYLALYPAAERASELRAREIRHLLAAEALDEAFARGRQTIPRIADPSSRAAIALDVSTAALRAKRPDEARAWAEFVLQDGAVGAVEHRRAKGLQRDALLDRAGTLAANPLEAAAHYEAAAAVDLDDPAAPAALYNAARGYAAGGDPGRARGIVESLVGRYPKAEIAADAAALSVELARASGDSRGTLVALERAAKLERDPDARRATWLAAADAALNAGEGRRAAASLGHFLTDPGTDLGRELTAQVLLARTLVELGDSPGAATAAKRAIARERQARSDLERAAIADAHLLLGDLEARRFRQITLREPLVESLDRKRAALDAALLHLESAARPGFTETTGAALQLAGALQTEFADAVWSSPRPRGLSAAESAEYDTLLEEQVAPYRRAAAKAHAAAGSRPGARQPTAAAARPSPASAPVAAPLAVTARPTAEVAAQPSLTAIDPIGLEDPDPSVIPVDPLAASAETPATLPPEAEFAPESTSAGIAADTHDDAHADTEIPLLLPSGSGPDDRPSWVRPEGTPAGAPFPIARDAEPPLGDPESVDEELQPILESLRASPPHPDPAPPGEVPILRPAG